MQATTVKSRPILFSGPMAKALLAGRKTQTRRVVKWPKNLWFDEGGYPFMGIGYSDCRPVEAQDIKSNIACPYGSPGDQLWVRETFFVDDYRYPDGPPSEFLEAIEYRASHDCANWEAGCPCSHGEWRPSIFMPKWASRITLEITEVRVERLHAISEADKLAEGGTPEKPFGTVWRAINTKPGIRWEDNPWVWVVSFRRINAEAE